MNQNTVSSVQKRLGLACKIAEVIERHSRGMSAGDVLAALQLVAGQAVDVMEERKQTSEFTVPAIEFCLPGHLPPERFHSLIKAAFEKYGDSLMRAAVSPAKGDKQDEPNGCAGHCGSDREGR